jgi:hypothetical protein
MIGAARRLRASPLRKCVVLVTNSAVSTIPANVANDRANDMAEVDYSKGLAMTTITSPFEVDIEAATERVRELNDKVLTAAKQTGNRSLDTYEQTVRTVLDFGQKVADSTKVEQISELAKSQASIIAEVTNAYTQAARELLK